MVMVHITYQGEGISDFGKKKGFWNRILTQLKSFEKGGGERDEKYNGIAPHMDDWLQEESRGAENETALVWGKEAIRQKKSRE